MLRSLAVHYSMTVPALAAALALSLCSLAVAQSSAGAAASIPGSVWEIACSDTTALEKPIDFDATALSAATEIMIISLDDCEDDDLPADDVIASLKAILATAAVEDRVEAEVGPDAEIVAATLTGTKLRVYLRAHHD